MEFDEMKKIWDNQNNEAFYGINEKALHQRILSKKQTVSHITNFSELLWIISNSLAGCFVLISSFLKPTTNISMTLLGAWMLGTAIYVLFSRMHRIRANNRFDKSMNADLDDAISTATYQVRFSQLGRWSIFPLGLFLLMAVWESDKSNWMMLAILIFFVLVNYATAWEHNIYKAKKHELEILRSKLENE